MSSKSRWSLVESPKSETFGGAEEYFDGGSSAPVFVNGGDGSRHSVEVEGSDVLEVGRETGSATETLLGRVQVVAEGDWEGVRIVGQPEREREGGGGRENNRRK